MMGLSHTVGYAVITLCCLSRAREKKVWVQAKEIALKTKIPEPYLSKVVFKLAEKGFVLTKRGVGGGIRLAHHPEEISMLDIVLAIDGESWFGECLLGMSTCNAFGYCPFPRFWSDIRKQIEAKLQSCTVADILNYAVYGLPC